MLYLLMKQNPLFGLHSFVSCQADGLTGVCFEPHYIHKVFLNLLASACVCSLIFLPCSSILFFNSFLDDLFN